MTALAASFSSPGGLPCLRRRPCQRRPRLAEARAISPGGSPQHRRGDRRPLHLPSAAMTESPAEIPRHGRAVDELLAEIDARHAEDIDWRGGRAFSLVYNADDPALDHLLEEVGHRYLHENALNPFKVPSVLQMELEVIAMAAGLFGAPPRAGSMSSGGTESIFLAVQVARDHARHQRGIAEPQIVTPSTAHPAFAKAAKYLDLEHVLVPVGDDGRADVAATEAAITDRTGLVVGS